MSAKDDREMFFESLGLQDAPRIDRRAENAVLKAERRALRAALSALRDMACGLTERLDAFSDEVESAADGWADQVKLCEFANSASDLAKEASDLAADLEVSKRYTLTVTTVGAVEFNDGRKAAVSFQETQRRLLLNKSNIRRLVEALAELDMALWTGCRVVIYHDPDIEFSGRRVGGIRVDTEATRAANASTTAAPSDAERIGP